MFPVTVSILVRSKTPPSTFTAPLTVENAASELAPWKTIVPVALLALTQGGEPAM